MFPFLQFQGENIPRPSAHLTLSLIYLQWNPKNETSVGRVSRTHTYTMPKTLPANYRPFAEQVLALFPQLNLTEYSADDQVLETEEFSIRARWFPANPSYPEGHHMRPPLLEIHVTRKNPPRNRLRHKAFVYRDGQGNPHPTFQGWQWHMW